MIERIKELKQILDANTSDEHYDIYQRAKEDLQLIKEATECFIKMIDKRIELINEQDFQSKGIKPITNIIILGLNEIKSELQEQLEELK